MACQYWYTVYYIQLKRAYFLIKSLKEIINHNSIRILYHACFKSAMKYGIILQLRDRYGKKVFSLQKKKGYKFDYPD